MTISIAIAVLLSQVLECMANNFLHYPTDLASNWRIARPTYNAAMATDDIPYRSMSRSQSEEDISLWEDYFWGMEHGLIIESGALDGMRQSTTLMLEKTAHWRAIHIEASPSNFRGLRANRPWAINIHSALCSHPQTLHYTVGNGQENGFFEHMPDAVRKQSHPTLSAEDYDDASKFLKVRCTPMKTLLSMMGVTHVDAWVLGKEGTELSVLEGMDFEAVWVDVIIMAADENAERMEETLDVITRHGFKCDNVIKQNVHCINERFTPSKKPN